MGRRDIGRLVTRHSAARPPAVALRVEFAGRNKKVKTKFPVNYKSRLEAENDNDND